MLKYIFLLMFFYQSISFGQSKYSLKIENIDTLYSNIKQIKPILKNTLDQSIFLPKLWPFGARLFRFNSETHNWEMDSHGEGYCGTVANRLTPIEIKTNQIENLYVELDLAFNDINSPKYFITEGYIERPINGKYKLVLSYSFEPWTIANWPEEIFKLESDEFFIKITVSTH